MRASGNWNGPVWAATESEAAGSAATPTANDLVMTTGNHTLDINTNAVCRTMYFNTGTLNLNGNSLYCVGGDFSVFYGNISHGNVTLNLGSGTLTARQFNVGSVSPSPYTHTIDAGTSNIILSPPTSGFKSYFGNYTLNYLLVNLGE